MWVCAGTAAVVGAPRDIDMSTLALSSLGHLGMMVGLPYMRVVIVDAVDLPWRARTPGGPWAPSTIL